MTTQALSFDVFFKNGQQLNAAEYINSKIIEQIFISNNKKPSVKHKSIYNSLKTVF